MLYVVNCTANANAIHKALTKMKRAAVSSVPVEGHKMPRSAALIEKSYTVVSHAVPDGRLAMTCTIDDDGVKHGPTLIYEAFLEGSMAPTCAQCHESVVGTCIATIMYDNGQLQSCVISQPSIELIEYLNVPYKDIFKTAVPACKSITIVMTDGILTMAVLHPHDDLRVTVAKPGPSGTLILQNMFNESASIIDPTTGRIDLGVTVRDQQWLPKMPDMPTFQHGRFHTNVTWRIAIAEGRVTSIETPEGDFGPKICVTCAASAGLTIMEAFLNSGPLSAVFKSAQSITYHGSIGDYVDDDGPPLIHADALYGMTEMSAMQMWFPKAHPFEAPKPRTLVNLFRRATMSLKKCAGYWSLEVSSEYSVMPRVCIITYNGRTGLPETCTITGTMPNGQFDAASGKAYGTRVRCCVKFADAIMCKNWYFAAEGANNRLSGPFVQLGHEESIVSYVVGLDDGTYIMSKHQIVLEHGENGIKINPMTAGEGPPCPQWVRTETGNVRIVEYVDDGVGDVEMTYFEGVLLSFGGFFSGSTILHRLAMAGVMYGPRDLTEPLLWAPRYFGPMSFKFDYDTDRFQWSNTSFSDVYLIHAKLWERFHPFDLQPSTLLAGIFVPDTMVPAMDCPDPFVTPRDFFRCINYRHGPVMSWVDNVEDDMATFQLKMLPVVVAQPSDNGNPIRPASVPMQLCAGRDDRVKYLMRVLKNCPAEITVSPAVWCQLRHGFTDPITTEPVLPKKCPTRGKTVVILTELGSDQLLDRWAIAGLHSEGLHQTSTLTDDQIHVYAKMMAMNLGVAAEYLRNHGREIMKPQLPLLGLVSVKLRVSKLA